MAYKVIYTKNAPEIGKECILCGKSKIEKGKYGGVLCRTCQIVWKDGGQKKEGFKAKEDRIMDALKIIFTRIEKIEAKVDRMLQKMNFADTQNQDDVPVVEE